MKGETPGLPLLRVRQLARPAEVRMGFVYMPEKCFAGIFRKARTPGAWLHRGFYRLGT